VKLSPPTIAVTVYLWILGIGAIGTSLAFDVIDMLNLSNLAASGVVNKLTVGGTFVPLKTSIDRVTTTVAFAALTILLLAVSIYLANALYVDLKFIIKKSSSSLSLRNASVMNGMPSTSSSTYISRSASTVNQGSFNTSITITKSCPRCKVVWFSAADEKKCSECQYPWTETEENGQKYYYNEITQETSWSI